MTRAFAERRLRSRYGAGNLAEALAKLDSGIPVDGWTASYRLASVGPLL